MWMNSQSSEKMEQEQKAMQEKAHMQEKALMEKKAMEEKAMMEQKAMEEKKIMEQDAVKKDDASMKKVEDTTTMNKETSMEKPIGAMMAKGSYDFYSADKLALADHGTVVLFFKASWCPSCKTVDADIKANRASIKEGLTILEVDYDNSAALKQKYGVTYQHTFVQVDSKGNLIAKWSGSPTLKDIEAHIK